MSIYWTFSKCSYDHCKFCAYALISPKQIPSAEKIKEELDGEIERVRKGSQQYVKIFNSGSYFALELPKWVKDLVKNYLIEKDCKKLRVENYYDRVNWDEIRELVDLGFDLTISWGLEIADNSRLKHIGKGTKVEELLQVMKMTKQLGVKNLVYVLAGLPGIPYEEFFNEYKRTVDWVHEQKGIIDECSSLVYTPMRFTVFYKTEWLTDKFRVMDKHIWKQCKEYAKSILNSEGIQTDFTEHQYWRYCHGKVYSEVHPKGTRKQSGKPTKFGHKTIEEKQQEKEFIKQSKEKSGITS
ncbi:MAG: radical SAM protein [Novosphingobium sp.]|nr:radical SAM protein [Novosphingobium sp.]